MFRVWLRYWLQIPGLPKIGDASKADVIAVQAFGRNTYTDKTVYRVAEMRQRFGGDDLATLNRLREDCFNPGRPNIRLAKECALLMAKYNIAAIVQWEVAAGFSGWWYEKHRDRIVILWPPSEPGKYYSTVDVKRDTWRIMQERGWRQVIELAHSWQVVRAYLILRRIMGYNPIAVRIATDDFDSLSKQVWTTNWLYWFVREALGRLHHVIYKLV